MSEPTQEPVPDVQQHFKRSFVNRVVQASIDQRLIVVFLALLLVGVGIWSFKRLPVDAYPDLSPPMVEIVTQWPGHAAEEVERLITAPTELVMNGLPGLKVMRSISLYGLSDVTLTFGDQTDNYFARQQAFERLPDLDLPDGVTPSIAPLFSPSGLVYRYVVESKDRSAMELKVIQDWVLERQYKSVPGVADMSSLGGETMQYQVVIDPVRLAGAGLSVPLVAAALAANNGNAGGGFYSEGGQFYYVRGLGRVETLEDIGEHRDSGAQRNADSGEGHRIGGDRCGATPRAIRHSTARTMRWRESFSCAWASRRRRCSSACETRRASSTIRFCRRM